MKTECKIRLDIMPKLQYIYIYIHIYILSSIENSRFLAFQLKYPFIYCIIFSTDDSQNKVSASHCTNSYYYVSNPQLNNFNAVTQ